MGVFEKQWNCSCAEENGSVTVGIQHPPKPKLPKPLKNVANTARFYSAGPGVVWQSQTPTSRIDIFPANVRANLFLPLFFCTSEWCPCVQVINIWVGVAVWHKYARLLIGGHCLVHEPLQSIAIKRAWHHVTVWHTPFDLGTYYI